jgi:hypothetical protein
MQQTFRGIMAGRPLNRLDEEASSDESDSAREVVSPLYGHKRHIYRQGTEKFRSMLCPMEDAASPPTLRGTGRMVHRSAPVTFDVEERVEVSQDSAATVELKDTADSINIVDC